MSTIEHQDTVADEDNDELLHVAKRLMRIDPLRGICNREKEERARRFYAHDQITTFFECYRKKPEKDSYEAKSDLWAINFDYKIILNPYVAVARIRSNYNAWKQYISNPSRDVPSELRFIAKDKVFVYQIAALDKYGIISLDPSKPFIEGNPLNGVIHIKCERPHEYIEEMLILWDALGRPNMNGSSFDSIQGLYEDFFSSRREKYSNMYYLSEGNKLLGLGYTWAGKYFGLEKFKEANSMERSIQESQPRAHFTFDISTLIERASLSMVFDSSEMNTLESISDLFPKEEGLVSRIVREYRIISTYTVLDERFGIDSLAREIHRDMFGADVPYGEGIDSNSPLYHSSALKHIRESPEQFEFWAEDPYMKDLYHDLVGPALQAKNGSELYSKL